MENLSVLITKVREMTNIKDKNGIKDSEVIRYFNDVKKLIQSTIFQAELEPELFVGTAILTVASGEQTVSLPSDTFAKNAVLYVEPYGETGKIRKIQSYERGRLRGYFLENGKIGFSASILQNHSKFTVKYFSQVPDVDLRRAKVQSVSGDEITLTDIDAYFSANLPDYVSIVNRDGEIIQDRVAVESLNTEVLKVDQEYSGIVPGLFIVMGKRSSSHVDLPDECEPFLLAQVERRMLAKNASAEVATQAVFSEEEKTALIGLFADRSDDPTYPPITDTSWGV